MKPAPITAQEVADALITQEHLAWSPTLLLRYSPYECIVRSPKWADVPRGSMATVAMYTDVVLGWFARKRDYVAVDALFLSLEKINEEELNWMGRSPSFLGVWLAVGPSLNIVMEWRGEVQNVRRIRRRLLVSFADQSAAWLRARTDPARWFEPSPAS